MPIQALKLWKSRYNNSRAVSCTRCDGQRRCICVYQVYVCVCFYMCQVCVSGVHVVIGTQNDQEHSVDCVSKAVAQPRTHKISISTAAQQQ